jgi:[acyl-carrier-protein] S-malonyltransferase
MQLKNLKTKFLGRNVFYYETIDSTQKEIARRINLKNIKDGTLIFADVQTGGIGTHGRVWHTDEKNNIAFSFFIKMNCNIKKLDGLTKKIAEIVVSIFKENYQIDLEIKEPNDIYCKEKKLGGILTETKVVANTVKYIIVGIGINTNKTYFSDDIKNIATSIKKEYGKYIETQEFIAEFCNRFESLKIINKKDEETMKTAFLFPGQGAQSIGMGKDIYEKYESARRVYKKVEELTGIDIAKISFEGPEEILNETKNTQLAILTESLAILEVLKEHNIKADISAGLSLGEYSALIYSGAISFEQGVKLVQKRGEYMQNFLPEGEWQMAAIMGMNEKQVEDVCQKVEKGFVVPANYNCEGQIAISGEKEAVAEAETIAKEMGVRKVIELKTAGPFHTEKLIDASNALRTELENITVNQFETKVVKNLDGDFYKETDDVKDILAKHIINPVRFSKTIQTMLDNGVDTFIEVGPGKTLSGFVKRTSTEQEKSIITVNNIASLEELINKAEQI